MVDPPDSAAGEAGSLKEAVVGWLQAARWIFADSLGLLLAEGRLAAISLLGMLALAMIGALAVTSIWFLLVAALSAALLGAGWSWPAVLLGVAAGNLLLAASSWLGLLALSRHLLLHRSLRQFRGHRGASATEQKITPPLSGMAAGMPPGMSPGMSSKPAA